jgi:hypothetical protein
MREATVFDKNKAEHRKLAELSAQAHADAAKFIAATELPDSIAKRRGMTRVAASKTLYQIDSIVAAILSQIRGVTGPPQVRGL